MKKIIYSVTLALSLLFAFSLHAQDETPTKESSNNLFIGLGYQNINADAFSRSLPPGVFGDITAPALTFTFGSSYFYHKFMFNWEFLSYFGRSNGSTQYQSRLTAFDGTINVGYTVWQKDNFKLYPTLGAGLGGGLFSFESRNQDATSFNDLFEINSAQISNTYLAIPLAINGDWFFGKKESVKFNVGWSIGYNLAFPIIGWRNIGRVRGGSSNSIEGIDDFTSQGFFVRTRIGVWSRYKK